MRVLLTVTASKDNDPRQVRGILLQVAQGYDQLQEEPEPEVFTDLDSTFNLAVWVEHPLLISRVTSELDLLILDEFAAQGVKV
jgi:small-conductance mechanosensitive channel